MLVDDRPKIKIRCYAILPFDKEFQPLKEAIKEAAKEIGIKLILKDEIIHKQLQVTELVYSEIARCDFVIADISQSNPNIMYEIGIAHAMGKFVAFLMKAGTEIPLGLGFPKAFIFAYDTTPNKIVEVINHFKELLEDFIHAPRKYRPFIPFPAKTIQLPYIVNLERIDPREFENLCFELITQMGFRRVEWEKEFKEIDVVATLSKKDPDGYEYQELWLISMGRNFPVEMMMESDHFLHRILRYSEGLGDLFPRYKIRSDVPITILIISRGEGPQPEFLNHELKKMENRLKERPYPFTVRIRLWDTSYLTDLIQQYPQIAFKYFSEEARVKSKYRKTPEEMYEENVQLIERLQITLNDLKEEKKKRFIAERDAAWKDVAFKASHNLGNPIDAIDTFLQSLKERLKEKQIDKAFHIANEMETSIEQSKTIIAQFKSLIKAQEISTRPMDLVPIIQHSCKSAEEKGVIVDCKVIENCPQVMIDPDKISECFNELVANAIHWFNKSDKKITISVTRPAKKELPENMDTTEDYLKILFEDNGCGILLENKEKIFAPFFTTYIHGIGLGLSQVKTIIEGHGGYISEFGKPDEGASFEIYLPVVKKIRRK
ncbi:hypothetical protein HY745_08490 [Candidatus Desantisbacteria bacterium]|nr:hypothetical protein [Candidatus Desantisbacteria bacterium]